MVNNIIYNDISKSNYFLTVNLPQKDYRFYFSSKFYYNKFKSNYKTYIESEYFKLKNKYNFSEDEININELFHLLIISCYNKIEKRGKRIYVRKRGANEWQKIQDISGGKGQII